MDLTHKQVVLQAVNHHRTDHSKLALMNRTPLRRREEQRDCRKNGQREKLEKNTRARVVRLDDALSF